MGCTNVGVEQFHEKQKKEKLEIIEKMKKEDENLKYNDPKKPTKNFCAEIMEKLPYKKEESKKRFILFQKLNNNKKSYISCKRLHVELTNYLELPEVVRKKDPINRAITAALEKYTRNDEHLVLGLREFYVFIYYLKQYFTYFEKFIKEDIEKCTIKKEDFKKALPIIEGFVNDIDESDFNKIDILNEKEITFDDFCDYVIQKNFEEYNIKDEEINNKVLKYFKE
jgi:hypothetical protein